MVLTYKLIDGNAGIKQSHQSSTRPSTRCNNTEYLDEIQKYNSVYLKSTPGVLEQSQRIPTLSSYDLIHEKLQSDSTGDNPAHDAISAPSENPRAYGTLLRTIPEVQAQASKFSSIRMHALSDTANIVLPKSFDGRVVWKDYLTPVMDQGRCGNCWAHATSSALADRFAIFSVGKIKFIPSPYELTVCSHNFTNIKSQWNNIPQLERMDDYLHGTRQDPSAVVQSAACQGASLFTAADVLFTDGVTTLDCFPNAGKSSSGKPYNVKNTGADRPQDLPYCHTLETVDFDTCVDGITPMKKYRAKTAYNIGDAVHDSVDDLESAIMHELYRSGPIATGFMVFSDFMEGYNGRSIYQHLNKSASSDGGHAVKIVGWGDGDDGLGNMIPYWLIQNSWGTDWGDAGFFRIKRKMKECQIEQNCLGMLPDFPGMVINNPNIIPVETAIDIENNEFKLHYLDPFTGYYLSAIEKVKSCKLVGDILPLIDPSLVLPNYVKFYAANISDYRDAMISQSSGPLQHIATCKQLGGVSSSLTDTISPTVVNPPPGTIKESGAGGGVVVSPSSNTPDPSPSSPSSPPSSPPSAPIPSTPRVGVPPATTPPPASTPPATTPPPASTPPATPPATTSSGGIVGFLSDNKVVIILVLVIIILMCAILYLYVHNTSPSTSPSPQQYASSPQQYASSPQQYTPQPQQYAPQPQQYAPQPQQYAPSPQPMQQLLGYPLSQQQYIPNPSALTESKRYF